MFAKCANPECNAGFDYRRGQFFRFHKNQVEGAPDANTHAVQHFWLCESCRERCYLDYRPSAGVLIHARSGDLPGRDTARIVAAA
jgi:hypothetical protein